MLKFSKRIQFVVSSLKPYLRWVILGVTLFFLLKAVKDNWQEVAAIRITGPGWLLLVAALMVTLLAHIWSGWVWTWILREFQALVPVGWGIGIYLKTNIAKYLPGNVWHFYGRILAVVAAGFSGPVAVLSVLIEPVLMAVAAGSIAGVGSLFIPAAIWQKLFGFLPFFGLCVFGPVLFFGIILILLHPWFLNRVMDRLRQLKKKSLAVSGEAVEGVKIERYPLGLLLGEVVFLLLRGVGFLLAVLAVAPANFWDLVFWQRLPFLLAGFSFAWLLGLVVPGAPGGIGIFETVAVLLLNSVFSAGTILTAVGFYRLISVLAESLGAGFAFYFWQDDRERK